MLSAALLAVALSSRVDAVPIADTPNAVRINGEVSEAAWQAATPMDGFLQREPEEGGQPSQRTEFRVVYDATTLYVKVRAFDTQADKIVSYLTRRATGYVSSFGELGGLTMTASPKRLEMLPYTVADLTRQRAGGNPLVKASSPSGAMGLDLKYALTPGLTLTTTVNPDFGQVEADPAVVNLSAFETFFSERRPFFVEGSGMFRFDSDCMDGPCQLFYSRRVGRSPQGVDELPSGDDIYAQSPTQTTILGAGKLTGRVGKFSIGAMSAVTQEEFGTVLDATHRFRQPIEPLTTYSIGRVRREFADQSSLGFMVTAAN